jgi:hypothetical protein
VLLAGVSAACSDDGDGGDAVASSSTSAATATTRAAVNPNALPLGDGHISTAPERGAVWSCQQRFPPNAPGAQAAGDWLDAAAGTWDPAGKPTVDGVNSWPHRFDIDTAEGQRLISSASVPNHDTGTFPVAPSDDAYRFDRNPNRIQVRDVLLELPASPEAAARPSCLPLGPIGILLTGSHFFNGLDAAGRDAVAHEIQDGCQGHPERQGTYHYHSLTSCLNDEGEGHSKLVGYALDGFGLFGHRGEDGLVVSNADLDECHGHTHAIPWNGRDVTLYHYHATQEYPYTLGCFRGTPAA